MAAFASSVFKSSRRSSNYFVRAHVVATAGKDAGAPPPLGAGPLARRLRSREIEPGGIYNAAPSPTVRSGIRAPKAGRLVAFLRRWDDRVLFVGRLGGRPRITFRV